MGQTLQNGIYLPAEGERNCYDGLEGNWRSLDGLISTVSGKASATHTHGNLTNDGKVGTTANMPLITGTGGVVQAGAFGNQANTFCEGNDSRLSDARTPVAHTHTKSDVTNLFNSANTWTGDNTYTAIISYQTSYTLGNPPQSAQAQQVIRALDTAGTNYLAQISTYQDTAATGLRFTIRDKFDSNGFSPSGSNRNKYLSFLQNASNQGCLQWDGYVNNNITPLANNAYDLGTSTNKWKSLNGINPGALSLPGEYTSSVTEYITDKTGGNNVYTAPADGWVGIQASSATFASDNFIFMGRTSDGTNYYAQNASSPINGYWSNLYHGCILLPVISGKTYGIRCKCDSVEARFYKANGNVS